MSALICLVNQTLPYTLVTLAGTLDDSSAVKAAISLRECLSAQPVALVIDASHVGVTGRRTEAWLLRFGEEAAAWPGSPILLYDPRKTMPQLAAQRFDALDEAVRAATGLPLPPRVDVVLPPVATSCATARVLVRDTFEAWDRGRYARLGELLISEMVANGVVHARTEMWVCLRDSGSLSLSVGDGDPRQVSLDPEERGNGLEIVAGLADNWGCMPTTTGKVVWASIGTGS